MTVPALPACLLALGLAFTALPVVAAPGDSPPAEQGDDQGARDPGRLDPAPSDGELTSFVSALLRLVGVEHGYMMMIQGENDPERVDEMKRAAIDDMTSAIEEDGLSLERYNAIATAMKTDSRLQSRVETILHQLAADPEDGE